MYLLFIGGNACCTVVIMLVHSMSLGFLIFWSFCMFHSIKCSTRKARQTRGTKSQEILSENAIFLCVRVGLQHRPYGLTNIIYSKMNKTVTKHYFMNFRAFTLFRSLCLSLCVWIPGFYEVSAAELCSKHTWSNCDRLCDICTIWWLLKGSAHILYEWNIYRLASLCWLKSHIFATSSE